MGALISSQGLHSFSSPIGSAWYQSFHWSDPIAKGGKVCDYAPTTGNANISSWAAAIRPIQEAPAFPYAGLLGGLNSHECCWQSQQLLHYFFDSQGIGFGYYSQCYPVHISFRA